MTDGTGNPLEALAAEHARPGLRAEVHGGTPPAAGADAAAEGKLERLRILVRLMTDLRALGRGSWLALPVTGEPVLYVRVRSGARQMAVLGVQDGGGWSYLWDGGQKAAADGTLIAARQIASVDR